MKVLKFVPMMQAQGCKVILYGPDEIACEPDEHVVITTKADRERWGFGDGFDTVRSPFLWLPSQPYFFEANTRAIDALRERVQPRDYLCVTAGWAHHPIAEAIGGPGFINPITVEWAVGYEGIFSPFCAFESYAWMHHVYGMREIRNGRAFDSVIPNFFDETQFHDPAKRKRKKDDDYLLYIGRVVLRKGPQVAAAIAERMGRRLLVAGPGPTSWTKGAIDAPEVSLRAPGMEYVGEVRFEERADLMAGAAAVIVPTLYVEPFGGVAVEAMMSGTPVVTSDWGSFTEIVTPNVGARFSTLSQAVAAVEYAETLDRKKIRKAAIDRYGFATVGERFTRWFDQLDTLWGEGWAA
jgi:glycosyltransferase involved in cell wall biosynthesis